MRALASDTVASLAEPIAALGLPWLVGLPVFGALLSVVPGPSWLWLVSALALAICLVAGLVLRPRDSVARSTP